jgi:hypothetical protein
MPVQTGILTGALALAAGALGGCHGCGAKGSGASASAPGAGPVVVLSVPKASGKIAPDGEVEEEAWAGAARTGLFQDRSGALARPSSEARILWDAQNLYLVLYAADENIQAKATEHDGAVWLEDAFSIVLAPLGAPGSFAIDVSAAGVVTDARRDGAGKVDPSWESGITLGVDRDGTLNDASDDDEEWIVEAALPWSALGVTPSPGMRIGLSLRRCDTPLGGKRTCGQWGEEKDGRPSGAIELR